MDYSHRFAVSCYRPIASINETHNIQLVQHQETGKIFVKKILNIYNAGIYEYLRNHHIPGIPDVIDFCEEDGKLTVIEEYIPGTTLRERIDAGKINMNTAISCMINLCEILEKLHSATPPIIHRDIKPSNIILTAYDKVILVDFNAAKYYNDASSVDTVLLGTQGYAAPEQYGFGSSSPQTDIYSVGILLKELSESVLNRTNIFDNIILRCTHIDPKDRYASVSELKSDFEKLAGKPVQTHSKTSSRFLLPGFRTKTPWKMILSSFAYLFIFWLCLSLQIENPKGNFLWLERITCLLMALLTVFVCFNYLDIQRLMPLCRHKNKFVRYPGIVLLDILMVCFLFVIMMIIESII